MADETLEDLQINNSEEEKAQTSAPVEEGIDGTERAQDQATDTAAMPGAESQNDQGDGEKQDERSPLGEQLHARAENQDFMRVLQQYVRQLPQVYYFENTTVQGDMSLRGQAQPAQPIPPPARTTTEIPSAEIRKIKHVYQRHAAYPQALRILRETRCAVLSGQPGVGKRAAALRLAVAVVPEDGAIHEVAPDESLVRQIVDAFQQTHAVIVVDGLVRSAVRDLTEHDARRILAALERQDNYIVICTRPGIGLPADLRRINLQPPAALPDLLLDLHLEVYGVLDAEERQRIVDAPEVSRLLEQGISPSQIDKLAQRMAETHQRAEGLQEVLSAFESVTEAEVEAWFDEAASDLDEATFRIALAVFSGSPYTSIREAGQALKEILQPADEDTEEPTGESVISPFLRKRTTPRLVAARAERVKRTVPKEYSEAATVEVVELQNKHYTLALLRFLWTEFDDLRGPLLDWLCHYAVFENQDLRLRASGAIGALAALDFDQMASAVFRRWTAPDYKDSEERRRRFQALGSAMGVLIWDDDHDDNVLGLLDAWVEKGSLTQRWAAARAFAHVGLRYPREAIRQWRRILESQSSVTLKLTDRLTLSVPHHLHMSVVDAIISLFALAVEFPHSLRPIYEEALEGLAGWVRDDLQNEHSQEAGLPLFLTLTSIGMPPDDGSGDPRSWPPAMLYVAGTQPGSSYQRALADLLRRSLMTRALRPHALEALKRWIAFADSEPWLQEVLEHLLRELLQLPETSGREHEILKVRLARLATQPKDPSETAQKLLRNLEL